MSGCPGRVCVTVAGNRHVVGVENGVVIRDGEDEVIAVDRLAAEVLQQKTDVVGVFHHLDGAFGVIGAFCRYLHGQSAVEEGMQAGADGSRKAVTGNSGLQSLQIH